ncbi:hypothetical protein D5086_001023 [Populus alba]|uniref:Uncharacterized protein n=2 Tax=Populus alba TaxID=43335 RepID=A0ACC4CXZ4_POPAL|nr:cellulose synthase-like protein [Populus alba]
MGGTAGSMIPEIKAHRQIKLMEANLQKSIHLLFYWILFENVMSLHRTKATLIGLLEAGRVNEWVITEKLGNTLQKAADARKANTKAPRNSDSNSPKGNICSVCTQALGTETEACHSCSSSK